MPEGHICTASCPLSTLLCRLPQATSAHCPLTAYTGSPGLFPQGHNQRSTLPLLAPFTVSIDYSGSVLPNPTPSPHTHTHTDSLALSKLAPPGTVCIDSPGVPTPIPAPQSDSRQPRWALSMLTPPVCSMLALLNITRTDTP